MDKRRRSGIIMRRYAIEVEEIFEAAVKHNDDDVTGFLIEIIYEIGKHYRQTLEFRLSRMSAVEQSAFETTVEQMIFTKILKHVKFEYILSTYDRWKAAEPQNKKPIFLIWDYYMSDLQKLRNVRIPLKVGSEIGDFLELEAKRRGFSVANLCAQIVGEWKANLESQRDKENER